MTSAVDGVGGFRSLIGGAPRRGAWVRVDRADLVAFDACTFHAPSMNYLGAASAGAAHGTHALALLLAQWDTLIPVAGVRRALLYGVDRFRVPSPLVPGDRVRASFAAADVRERGPGAFDCAADGVLERSGPGRPVCVARVVIRLEV